MNKEKKLKILKNTSNAFGCAAIAGSAVTILGIVGCMAALAFEIDRKQIANKAGYSKFNEKYHAEQVVELSEQFEAGEIDYEKYLFDVEHLDDYDHDNYMEEYANAQEQEEYNRTLKARNNTLNISLSMVVGGCSLAGVGSIVMSCLDKKREKVRNELNASSKPKYSEPMDISEVVDHLTLVNSFVQDEKEKDR